MAYSIIETHEAIDDVTALAAYMIDRFKNHKAALDFLDNYDMEVNRLSVFPFGYRGIGIEYRGYEMRLKPFGTYNIFFVVDIEENTIIVLRLLKNLQNWQSIIQSDNEYEY
jgi:plasmid stabilization system protein ParE